MLCNNSKAVFIGFGLISIEKVKVVYVPVTTEQLSVFVIVA